MAESAPSLPDGYTKTAKAVAERQAALAGYRLEWPDKISFVFGCVADEQTHRVDLPPPALKVQTRRLVAFPDSLVGACKEISTR